MSAVASSTAPFLPAAPFFFWRSSSLGSGPVSRKRSCRACEGFLKTTVCVVWYFSSWKFRSWVMSGSFVFSVV